MIKFGQSYLHISLLMKMLRPRSWGKRTFRNRDSYVHGVTGVPNRGGSIVLVQFTIPWGSASGRKCYSRNNRNYFPRRFLVRNGLGSFYRSGYLNIFTRHVSPIRNGRRSSDTRGIIYIGVRSLSRFLRRRLSLSGKDLPCIHEWHGRGRRRTTRNILGTPYRSDLTQLFLVNDFRLSNHCR